jgi:hypothetical protein
VVGDPASAPVKAAGEEASEFSDRVSSFIGDSWVSTVFMTGCSLRRRSMREGNGSCAAVMTGFAVAETKVAPVEGSSRKLANVSDASTTAPANRKYLVEPGIGNGRPRVWNGYQLSIKSPVPSSLARWQVTALVVVEVSAIEKPGACSDAPG